ncbi:hypothetical protein HYV87_05915 [Candidatus Woesearchaeota archaeon]|nr:hypothetical protein [Candidatus Woesearchaeota archaeon]
MTLSYTHTNENLRAIIRGLDLTLEDSVIAVGGSGDQAFAMLEFAGKVKVFDTSLEQLEYIKERAEALQRGYFSGFLKYGSDIDDEAEKSISYFWKDKRLEKIRQKLQHLSISQPGDMMELAQQESSYSRVYLSNAIGYFGECLTREEIMNCLEKANSNLMRKGLIYVSHHENLVHLSLGQYAPKNSLWIKSFLPNKLDLHPILSLTARVHERKWMPAVYQKTKE